MTTSHDVDIIWAEGEDGNRSSQPLLHQHGIEVQRFGSLRNTKDQEPCSTDTDELRIKPASRPS